MLSDKEIKSLIWVEVEDQNQGDEQEENILDLSHQELRRLKTFELKELNVQRVNASYNFFKDLGSLNFKEFNQETEHSIRWLDVSFNFITNIDESSKNCHILASLRYLNVSANQIESVDFSSLQLPLLQTLNINSNKVKYFLHCPQNLKVLAINDNLLDSLAFTGGKSLNILTAKQNSIKSVGISLQNLNVFDIQSNKVDDIEMVKQFLKNSPNLLAINMRENPVSKNKGYKVSVFENCQQIAQIDDILINPHIRQGFKVLKAEQQLNQMLDRANKKYEMQLVQKQKIKDQMIKKIREKEKLAEENFYKNIDQQRKQFELLEKQAQQIIAKGKLNAPEEKNKLKTPLNEYLGEQAQPKAKRAQKTKKQTIQKKHLHEYLQYLNRRRPESKGKKQSQIKRTSTKNISLKGLEGIKQETHVDFKKIKLFDQRAIKPLLQNYTIDMIEM